MLANELVSFSLSLVSFSLSLLKFHEDGIKDVPI